MPRYVLEVMYDGTKFHGSQIQGEQVTVQLALNKALSTILRKPISTYGASRTDEGVHALCNFYHFDNESDIEFDLKYKCNSILPGCICVKQLYEAANPEFNARFEAIERRYRYRIYAAKNPFLLDRAMYYPYTLNHDLLSETAAIILKHGHFESFSKRKAQSKTFICNIKESYWEHAGEELHYVVAANRFLRGMVRGLVGTQLHIAREKGTISDFNQIIAARDCTKAFFDVPGHGGGCDRTNGRAVVKGFANAPRTALFLHVVLQIATRHVQAHGIAVNVLHGIGRRDVFAAFANRHHQLNFVVEILGLAGVGDGAGFTVFDKHQGVGGFQEEKRWFTSSEAHFFGVFFVVAPHAVNAVHREGVCLAHDRDTDNGRGSE